MSWSRNFLRLFIPLIFLGLILRFFFVQSLVVQTERLSPTLLRGDFLIGVKTFSPQRGDLVAYSCVHRRVCIGRVLGVAGDRLDFEKSSRVQVNGRMSLPLKFSDATQLKSSSFVVHPASYFLEGDESGEILVSQVQSVLFRVLVSVDPQGGKIRWSRIWFSIH